MKVGSSTIIPLGMRSKKHFCYNCGGRLYANPNTRKVYPKDKDWKKYSKIGLHGHMLPVGYVEVTEYNLKCPDCADVKEYDDQLVLEMVQKKTGKNILTDTDLQEHLPSAIEATLKRKKKRQCYRQNNIRNNPCSLFAVHRKDRKNNLLALNNYENLRSAHAYPFYNSKLITLTTQSVAAARQRKRRGELACIRLFFDTEQGVLYNKTAA